MMSTSNYTITTTGVALSAGSSPTPQGAPKGLIVTRAVQVKDGWVGQLIVGEEILWESAPKEDARDAEEEATERVLKRIKRLFT